MLTEIGIIFGLMLAAALAVLLFQMLKNPGKKKTWPLTLAVAFTGISLGVYFLIGRPDLLTPVVADSPSEEQGPEIDNFIRAVEQLEARMEEQPNNVEGWATLGAGYSTLGRFSDATMAYIKASKLDPENPDYHAAIGEAVTLANDGKVTEDARAAFETALAYDPGNGIAQFYLGQYDFDIGNFQGAYDRWLALYEGLPPETPWLNLVEKKLETAADQLATRLEENPEDMEGWFRLGQSYMVLGRHKEAADALFHLVQDRPDDPAALSFYLQAKLIDLEKNDLPLPPEVISQVERLEELNPNDTTALYYLGVAALQAGDPASAKTIWEKLLILFPPGSGEAIFVEEKLTELDDGSG